MQLFSLVKQVHIGRGLRRIQLQRLFKRVTFGCAGRAPISVLYRMRESNREIDDRVGTQVTIFLHEWWHGRSGGGTT